jgi:hypothetical protein
MGPKSKHDHHLVNMRMMQTARMRDRAARDITLLCVNPEEFVVRTLISRLSYGQVRQF